MSTLATWDDVTDLVRGLPDAAPEEEHEGSPAYDAGRHHLAFLRWDDDRRELAELLLDSYRIRGGVRRGTRVAEAAFFARV